MSEASGKIHRALISVFDKAGLEPLAQRLHKLGVEILASGGTAAALQKAGIPVVTIETFTEAPEVLGGRVKTLHPRVHAGILADRREAEHLKDLTKHQYAPIDLVVCNLYPFAQYLKEGKPRSVLIEKIDIGGPTLIRAAAKNVDGGVTVLSSADDYQEFADVLEASGHVPTLLRRQLAARAFRRVAQYDQLIADWAEREVSEAPAAGMPPKLSDFNHHCGLRYGENPHQAAALYVTHNESGIAQGELLSGKELSYNNYLDMDAAYRAAYILQHPGCVIVKHTNPCGMSQADPQHLAFERALAGDPLAAFGSVIGFNSTVQLATVQALKASKVFVECIVAPGFADDALAELKKRENLRLFVVPKGDPTPKFHAHRIGGGMLVQQADLPHIDPTTWQVVTHKALEATWINELAFAMKAAAVLKSNAIAVTAQQTLLGAGAGHMSRIDAAEQAFKKAGDKARGAFLGSDAFFPFDDTVRAAAKMGIAAIVQPGGSKRDQDSIDACNAANIAMVFTGRRHFRH